LGITALSLAVFFIAGSPLFCFMHEHVEDNPTTVKLVSGFAFMSPPPRTDVIAVRGRPAARVPRPRLLQAARHVSDSSSPVRPCRYLHREAAALGRIADMTIEELGLLADKAPVLSVEPHLPAILAYEKLQAAGEQPRACCTITGKLPWLRHFATVVHRRHNSAQAATYGTFSVALNGRQHAQSALGSRFSALTQAEWLRPKLTSLGFVAHGRARGRVQSISICTV
jgi:hypothetical protein